MASTKRSLIKVRLPSQQMPVLLPSSIHRSNQEKQEWKLVDSSFKKKEEQDIWNEFVSLDEYPTPTPAPQSSQPIVPVVASVKQEKQIPIEDPIDMISQDPLLTLVLSPSNSENDSMMQCDAVEVVNATSNINNTVTPPLPATHRIGSGSRSQWKQLDTDTRGKLAMPLGGLVSGAELDMALANNNDDNMSLVQSEATFVTGNVSRNNSSSSKSTYSGNPNWFTESKARPLKPLKSPLDIQGRRRRTNKLQQPAKRDESPPNHPLGPRRLMMCGAVNMDNNELVHDVNTTVRQIVTTVRKFGVEEKKAVRNFFSCRAKEDDSLLGQNHSLDLEIDDSYDIMSLDRELSSSSCLEQTHESSIVEPTVSNDSDMISEGGSILTESASINNKSEEVEYRKNEIEFKPKRRLV